VERYYCLEGETYSIKTVLNGQVRYTCTFFPLRDKLFFQFYVVIMIFLLGFSKSVTFLGAIKTGYFQK
jgi:hypothetical protein